MKKNVVKVNDSTLRQIISESVKSVVKEISLRTLDNANTKSGGYEGYTERSVSSDVLEAIKLLEMELGYHSEVMHNGQAGKLLLYLGKIKDFLNRKGKQALNFSNSAGNEKEAANREFLAKARNMFNKNVSELSEEEYEKVLASCSPRTQEYVQTFC